MMTKHEPCVYTMIDGRMRLHVRATEHTLLQHLFSFKVNNPDYNVWGRCTESLMSFILPPPQ